MRILVLVLLLLMGCCSDREQQADLDKHGTEAKVLQVLMEQRNLMFAIVEFPSGHREKAYCFGPLPQPGEWYTVTTYASWGFRLVERLDRK